MDRQINCQPSTNALPSTRTASRIHTIQSSLLLPRKISALPTETLSQIFMLLVKGEYDRAKRSDYANFTLYPWRLLEVCKDWRAVCLGDPFLWSYISLNGHDCTPEKQHDTAPFRRIRLHLQRSRDLQISFDATRMCRCKCEVARFRVVLAHAPRWRIATFNFCFLPCPQDTRPDSDFIRSLIPNNVEFSSLRELECWINPADSDNFAAPLDCSTSHSLQTAVFNSLGSHWFELEGDIFQDFPWERLSTLILSDYVGFNGELMDLLIEGCGMNLVRLELTSCSGPESLSRTSARNPSRQRRFADLQRLASLVLAVAGREESTPLLTWIAAPNLRTLALDYMWSGPKDIPTLQAFLLPCQTSLTTLSLHHPVETDPEDFFLFLKARSQNIRHFCLRGEQPEDPEDCRQDCNEFLEGAARRDVTTGAWEIFPRLESLELEDVDFDPVLLAQMVEARTRTAAQSSGADGSPTEGVLQSLTIRWHCGEEDLARAKYHTETAQEVLEEFVRERKLRFEAFITMED